MWHFMQNFHEGSGTVSGPLDPSCSDHFCSSSRERKLSRKKSHGQSGHDGVPLRYMLRNNNLLRNGYGERKRSNGRRNKKFPPPGRFVQRYQFEAAFVLSEAPLHLVQISCEIHLLLDVTPLPPISMLYRFDEATYMCRPLDI